MKLKNPPVTTKLVKHLIKDHVQGDPSLKPNQIVSIFKKTYGSNIKYHHAHRGREAVYEESFGDAEKSYTELVWYIEKLKETNPLSYVDFQYDEQSRRFERLFICFGACKEGYRYVRAMIYLDATFLTGTYRGSLMAATCVNGNTG